MAVGIDADTEKMQLTGDLAQSQPVGRHFCVSSWPQIKTCCTPASMVRQWMNIVA
jgi:hypothetical protein